MNDLVFLLPIAILGLIAGIFGTWMKVSADREERRARNRPTTNH